MKSFFFLVKTKEYEKLVTVNAKKSDSIKISKYIFDKEQLN